MDRVYFFSGQQVENDDLNDISESLSSALKNRTVDFFYKGVVNSNAVFVVNDRVPTIKINAFVAYTPTGERINVSRDIRGLALDLTNPTENRLTHQGSLSDDQFGWEENVTYDIYVNYIEKSARPRAHKTENEYYPTRIISGFEFYAIKSLSGEQPVDRDGKKNMVRLCRLVYTGTQVLITTDGFTEYTTIDARKLITDGNFVRPSTYNPMISGNKENLQAHMYCVGSGTPTPTNPHGITAQDIGIGDQTVENHETTMHTAGIYGDDARKSTESALYVNINNVSTDTIKDSLTIYNLHLPERLHANGSWYDAYDYKEPNTNTSRSVVYLHFEGDGSSSSEPIDGLYRIGLNLDTLKITACLVVGESVSYSSGKYKLTLASSAENYRSGESGFIEYVSVLNYDDYTASNVFDLAEVKYSVQKQISSAISAVLGRSNFIEKNDLRVFGSTAPMQFATTKQVVDGVIEDVLDIPFIISVKDIKKEGTSTTVLNKSSLPTGYIQGFNIVYNNDISVTVKPGICRDLSDEMDIRLKYDITKSISDLWAPGSSSENNIIGGLQNIEHSLQGFHGKGLHVFVISTVDGVVDVAFDTSITATGIRKEGTLTEKYSYIRRIGTIYLSHHLDDPENSSEKRNMDAFTTISDGQGIWTLYKNQQLLEQSEYDDAETSYKFNHVNVPTGYNFMGKFAYRSVSSETGTALCIYRPVVSSTNNKTRLSGFGETTLFLSDNSFKACMVKTNGAESPFDFKTDNNDNTYYSELYCIGYYDSRSI